MEESSMVVCNIPVDIIINILSRLPFKVLVRCRPVCKLWFNVINDPLFVSTHLLSPSRDPFVYVASIKDETKLPHKRRKRKQGFNFHVLKVVGNNVRESRKVWKKSGSPSNIKYRSHNNSMVFVGSSKGLVCFRDEKVLHILNPLFLNDILKVPLLSKECALKQQGHETPRSCMSYSFGFDESSNSFKVVCMVKCGALGNGRQHSTSNPFVLDLGIGNSSTSSTRFRWRALSSPSIRYPCLHGKTNRALFFDGDFMFLGSRRNGWFSGNREILSFNLEKERFKVVSLPKVDRWSGTQFSLFDFDGVIGLLGCGTDNIIHAWARISDEWVEESRFQMHQDVQRLQAKGFDKSKGYIIFKITRHRWYAYNTQTRKCSALPLTREKIIPLHQGSLMCASNLTPLDLSS